MLAVTAAANAPLNHRLAAARDPSRNADLAAVRQAFETTWVRGNLVRTVLCTGAFSSLVRALVLRGRSS